MDCGLLRVTRAGASEPGWPLCVTSDSGHSKFHVLREPGLSDGPWRQSVTLSAQSRSPAQSRTTHCGPLPTAVSLSTPLTRLELALVFRDYW